MRSFTTARLSWYLAVGSVILAFTLSGNLLAFLGTSYISDGGSLFGKVHPASYAVIMSALLKIGPVILCCRDARSGRPSDWHICVFLVGIVFCATYAFAAAGPGNVIVFVDTFLPAGLLAFVLRDLPPSQMQQLLSIIKALLILNATIAVIELITQSHLVPVPAYGDDFAGEFRPTALYDHPMTGAAATMLGLWLPYKTDRGWYFSALVACALLAFGERTPLAAAALIFGSCSIGKCFEKLLQRNLTLQDISWCLAAPVAAMGIGTAVISQYIGPRLGAHLYWDSSAQVRLSQFGILNLLSPLELLFGCPRETLLGLVEPLRLSSHVAVIENFWLLTLITLGLAFFPVFVVSFIALLQWLWSITSGKGRLMIMSFIAVASASNSLGRKSTLLVTLVACVIAASPGLCRMPEPLSNRGLT